MKPEAGSNGTATQDRVKLISQVLWAIPRVYHRLSEAGETIYSGYNLTSGKRSLLNDLVVQGPHSIVQMVRARPPISRQYIQRLVSELRLAGMVELTENPGDRRSKIVKLTRKGQDVIDALTPQEHALAEHLMADHNDKELETAGTVLTNLAKILETGTPEYSIVRQELHSATGKTGTP